MMVMRLKIVIPVIVLGLIVFLIFQSARPRESVAGFHPALAKAASPRSKPEISPRRNSAGRAAVFEDSAVAPNEISEEIRSQQVADRVAELMDLAMSDDASSLDTILSELNNSDPRLREAAVEAAVQFKSSKAVPALRDAAERAVDPEEKVRILKAIEFLSSSAPTEVSGTPP